MITDNAAVCTHRGLGAGHRLGRPCTAPQQAGSASSGHCGYCHRISSEMPTYFAVCIASGKLISETDQPQQTCNRNDRVLHRRDRGPLLRQSLNIALHSAAPPVPRQSYLQCNNASLAALQNGKFADAADHSGQRVTRAWFPGSAAKSTGTAIRPAPRPVPTTSAGVYVRKDCFDAPGLPIIFFVGARSTCA